MILAHHSIVGFYGFWMPNDPRGSGSDYIANWELSRYGRGTKVTTRRSVAYRPKKPAWQAVARTTLKFPPVAITGGQAVIIARGFAKAIQDGGYHVHACAILPDHLHLVISRHPRDIDVIVGHFKSEATKALRASEKWPSDNRPIWGEHGWNVALDNVAAIDRAIKYAEYNPEKESKRRQNWSIVSPFDLSAVEAVASLGVKKRRIGGAALASMRRKRERLRRREGP